MATRALRQPLPSKIGADRKGDKAAERPSVKLGDHVWAADRSKCGTVRFVGRTKFKEGMWVGLELDTAYSGMGKNNGTVNNVKYFDCIGTRGVFLPLDKVVPDSALLSSTLVNKLAKKPSDSNLGSSTSLNSDTAAAAAAAAAATAASPADNADDDIRASASAVVAAAQAAAAAAAEGGTASSVSSPSINETTVIVASGSQIDDSGGNSASAPGSTMKPSLLLSSSVSLPSSGSTTPLTRSKTDLYPESFNIAATPDTMMDDKDDLIEELQKEVLSAKVRGKESVRGREINRERMGIQQRESKRENICSSQLILAPQLLGFECTVGAGIRGGQARTGEGTQGRCGS
jgi:hypothetical protein